MDDQTRRGYARLLRDLQAFEPSDPLRISLEKAKASIDEFERLIVRLDQLSKDQNDRDS